ncbi:MAG: hypothetical protein ABR907_13405 [Terracidiphilus sp.]|jgi:hypothetical protein
MTWLQGRVVRFRLSQEGKQALAGAFEKDSILGLVEVVDDIGAWIVVGTPVSGKPRLLRLLKWDYFSTAVLEIEPVEEAPRLRIGFQA